MDAGNPSFTQSTDRGPSPSLWEANGAHTMSKLQDNPTLGWYEWDDFIGVPTSLFTNPTLTTQVAFGRYKAFAENSGSIQPTSGGTAGTVGVANAAGTITTVPEVGGILKFVTGTGDNDAISLQSWPSNFQIFHGTGKVFFEARVKLVTSVTLGGMFIGLMEQQTLAAAVPFVDDTGAFSANLDAVGFMKVQAIAGYVDSLYVLDGTKTVIQTGVSTATGPSATAMVADTYVKLGFFYDSLTGLVTFYRNGLPLTTTKTVSATAGSGFPNNVLLAPTFAYKNSSAAASTICLDWWYCQQQPQDNVT